MFARMDDDPPSNLIIDPVTNADAFVDKNNVNPAISLALPIRPTEKERNKNKNKNKKKYHNYVRNKRRNKEITCTKVCQKSKKTLINRDYFHHLSKKRFVKCMGV